MNIVKRCKYVNAPNVGRGIIWIRYRLPSKEIPGTDSFYGLADKNPRVLIACFTPINDYYVGN